MHGTEYQRVKHLARTLDLVNQLLADKQPQLQPIDGTQRIIVEVALDVDYCHANANDVHDYPIIDLVNLRVAEIDAKTRSYIEDTISEGVSEQRAADRQAAREHEAEARRAW